MNPERLKKVREDVLQAELIKGPHSSMAEDDPYSAAVELIAVALEWALDDGISGSMNQREFENLDALAKTLMSLDPSIELEVAPR